MCYLCDITFSFWAFYFIRVFWASKNIFLFFFYFQADSVKEKGNACVQEQKYAEAVLLYTQALQLDPNNYTLHSNRSLAFLKMQQYYLAMEDALATIKLAPTWPKVKFA